VSGGPDTGRPRIVVVGGGAGGLELVTRLGDRLGKRGLADVTLVDARMTHVWKPLLHEVAAGTLYSHEDEVNYLVQASGHHFTFRLGAMERLDRRRKVIGTAATLDQHGEAFIPSREFPYDILVLAVGGVSNDFGIEGVAEHCHFLDYPENARDFHLRLLHNYYAAQAGSGTPRPGQLHVAIAGAGATGVELAAELHNTTRQLVSYGLDRINPESDVRIAIIEAAADILPHLPRRAMEPVRRQMQALGIELHTGRRITRADARGFHLAEGGFIEAELKVWAAGVKAPAFLAGIDGLETNDRDQLVVSETLQCTRDPDIFAFGDCAACPWPGREGNVPPRAQAAHQQANHLTGQLRNRLRGRPPRPYRYTDYGTLINLSRYGTVGNLMGNFARRCKANVFLEGLLARLFYLSLYKMHLAALQGLPRVVLMTCIDLLTRRLKAPLKLH